MPPFRLFRLPVLSLFAGLLALGLSHGRAFAAESAAAKTGPVEAQLVTDAAAITPGRPFTVALRLQHAPHWHTYWIAPGTGYPTSLTWTLPEGFTAGDIQWPTPHIVRDRAGKVTGNGYEHEVLLLVEITPPNTLAPGSTVKLAAFAEWLMCETVCVPGEAKLEFSLPVGEPAVDAKWSAQLATARALLPVANNAWDLSAAHDGHTLTLQLAPKPNVRLGHQPQNLHFFATDGFNDYAKPQVVRAEGGGWVIESPLDSAANKETKRLTGVLASANGWGATPGYGGLGIDVPLVARVAPNAPGSAAGSNAQPSTLNSQPPAAPGSLLGTLFLAFVGGLILNLMPCVFPVLGIKILGFVNQSGQQKAKVVQHGLMFTLGVLVSFWALAGLLLALRSGGAQLGWGFQLQSPAFVFAMAAFLLVFALNLSGLFEVGLSATGAGAALQSKEGLTGSFFTGALATLVATPCSAPFLAPALGAALTLSPAESLLVFTAIAVGLALPYLLLSLFPQAIRYLPRPGAWMETFKQFMAFPLYATVGWLLWVLAAQTADDDYALLMISFAFVLLALAGWFYGRFGQAHGQPGRQWFGRIAAVVVAVWGLWLGWPRTAEAAPAAGTTAGYQVVWEKWSPEAVAAAQAAGKFAYVDFTARWCATCQTNKAAVFASSDVLAEFERKNVVLFKADWTNRDAQITAELARWNRSAVPFNLIYAPGKPDPVVLPELLTPGKVLELLAVAAQ